MSNNNNNNKNGNDRNDRDYCDDDRNDSTKTIVGTRGNDTLAGTSSNDRIIGREGNDTFIYRMSQNKGDRDAYDGDKGTDTLRLEFTAAEWQQSNVQSDVARFLESLDDCRDGGWFEFKAFGLKVTDIEKLEIYVDGVKIDTRDDKVDAVNDTATVVEDGAVTGNVLANDSVPDLVKSVVLVEGPEHGTLTLDARGNYSFTPGAYFNSLGAGQTATETFKYKVTDLDGDSDTAVVTIKITGTNDGPVAKADAYAAGEDTVLNIAAKGVLANDTDVDTGDVLKVSSTGTITSQMGATVKLNADGSFSYDARSAAALQALNDGQTAIDSFNYTVSDGNGGSATATVKVTVTGSTDNRAPVAKADSYGAGEDTVLSIAPKGVLANDTDADGDVLKVSSTGTLTSTKGASVLLNADGSFSYDARSAAALQSLGAGQTAADSFNYTVSDGKGGSATATVTITVKGSNDGPVARADNYAAGEDAVLTIAAKGVLLNDSDIDTGDVLKVTSTGTITSQYGAKVTMNADGSFSYDATGSLTLQALNDGQSLDDSFSYAISDGNGGSATATVKVTVAGASDNHAPDAVNDDFVSHEGPAGGKNPVPLNLGNVLGNDSDADGDALTLTPVSYFLDNGWRLAIDASGEATLTGPVKPTIKGNAFDALGEGETLTIAADLGGNALTYAISDGQLGDTANVTVTLIGRNDGPEAFGVHLFLDEDSSYTLSLDELGWDVDTNDTLTWDIGDAGNGAVTLNGDGTITFTPGENFNGTDSFSYTLTDQHGASSTGVVEIIVNAVNDAPDALNDDFVAHDGPVGGKMPVPLDLGNVLGNDSDVDGDGLAVTPVSYALDNGWTLYIDQTGAASLHAPAKPIKKGQDYDSLGEGETLTFTTDADGNALTYAVSDTLLGDTADVTVTLIGRNDGPEAFGYFMYLDEDSSYTVSLEELGWDVDTNDTLTWDFGAAGNGAVTLNGDGTVTFAPGENFNGNDSFSYTITDQHGASSTGVVDITVAPVNDAPVALDDSLEVQESSGGNMPKSIALGNVLGNDSDVDGDAVAVTPVIYALDKGWQLTINAAGEATLSVSKKPTKGSLDFDSLGEGETLTISTDAHGNALTYAVSDSLLGDTADVTITLIGRNDAPEAFGYQLYTDEGMSYTFGLNELGSDADVNDTLTWDFGAAAHGQVVMNADGTLTYTPDAEFFGTDSFSYTLTDQHGASSTGVVDIYVDPADVNHEPIVFSPNYDTAEDTAFSLLPGIALGADPDNDPVTFTFGEALYGTVTVDPDDSTLWRYVPLANFNGTDTVIFTITDSHGASNSGTFTVTVTPVNDAPVAVDDAASAPNGWMGASIDVLSNDFDIDGDALSLVYDGPLTSALGATLTLQENGTFFYDPSLVQAVLELGQGESLDDSFSYTISDGHGGTATATAKVHVTGLVNTAPTASADMFDVDEDAVLTGNLLLNDSDPDAFDWIVATPASFATANGSVVILENGFFTYTPNPDFSGGDVFDYVIHDRQGASSTAQVVVFINPVNDPLVAYNDTAETNEDVPLQITAEALLANDIDIDPDDTKDIVSIDGTEHGTVEFDGTTITFTPDANFHGVGLVHYTVQDSTGTRSSATLGITIHPENDAPELQQPLEDHDVAAGAALAISIPEGAFADPEGDAFTYAAVLEDGSPLPGWLSFDTQTGSFSGTPDTADAGQYIVLVTATDVHGAESSTVFAINVSVPEITGTDGDDEIFGTAGDDEIHGLAGNDHIDGGAGNDYVLGGDGDDYLEAYEGNDSLFGNDGNDTFYAAFGSYVINAGAGADQVSLIGTVDTSIDLGADADSDTLVLDGSSGPVTVHNFNAGAGGDVLDLHAALLGYTDEAASDFITLTTDGADTRVFVDRDGQGSTYGLEQVAVLQDRSGLTVGSLLGDGNLLLSSSNGVNNAPTLGFQLPHLYIPVGGLSEFDLPANAFTDVDGDDLTYSIGMVNGFATDALWIDPQTGHIQVWGVEALPGRWDVRLTATDPYGEAASDVFSIFLLDASPVEWQGTADSDVFSVSYVENAILDAGAGDDFLYVEASGGGIMAGDGNDNILVWDAAPWAHIDAGAGADRVGLVFDSIKMGSYVDLGVDADRDTIEWQAVGPWPEGDEVVEIANFKFGPAGDTMDLRYLLIGADGSSDINDFVSLAILEINGGPPSGPVVSAELAFSVDLDGAGTEYGFQQLAVLHDVQLPTAYLFNLDDYLTAVAPTNIII